MRTPALNLLRQEPATIAATLHHRLARARGHFWVVVRRNGDVIEYPACRLPAEDEPHRIGRYTWRLPVEDLAADLVAARTVLLAQRAPQAVLA